LYSLSASANFCALAIRAGLLAIHPLQTSPSRAKAKSAKAKGQERKEALKVRSVKKTNKK
jgi:hypothetical protein